MLPTKVLAVLPKRDSNAWWWVMALAVLGVLYTDPHMVSDLVSGDREKTAQAIVKLLGLVLIGGTGVARMSPLGISPEGRQAEMEKKAGQLDVASVVAAVASEKADIAVTATTEAASASQMAKEISEKAAQ